MRLNTYIHPRAVTVLFLAVLFFILHQVVYVNGNASEIAVIMSSADEAYNFPGVTVDAQLRPNYVHPFRPVTFTYHVEQSREEIVEQAVSIFFDSVLPGGYDGCCSYK